MARRMCIQSQRVLVARLAPQVPTRKGCTQSYRNKRYALLVIFFRFSSRFKKNLGLVISKLRLYFELEKTSVSTAES